MKGTALTGCGALGKSPSHCRSQLFCQVRWVGWTKSTVPCSRSSAPPRFPLVAEGSAGLSHPSCLALPAPAPQTACAHPPKGLFCSLLLLTRAPPPPPHPTPPRPQPPSSTSENSPPQPAIATRFGDCVAAALSPTRPPTPEACQPHHRCSGTVARDECGVRPN